jgi:uncharacterized beta-barrel protein YwiB (DUF1934 family)
MDVFYGNFTYCITDVFVVREADLKQYYTLSQEGSWYTNSNNSFLPFSEVRSAQHSEWDVET